jgi:hypothetical protein
LQGQLKENDVEEEAANDIAGVCLVPFTERCIIHIGIKAPETKLQILKAQHIHKWTSKEILIRTRSENLMELDHFEVIGQTGSS